MIGAPDWAVDGKRWHVQMMGAGPVALLLHGTGASTHSWRGLAPLLAERFTVIAPDLPGHGFTELPRAAQMSLPGMARAVTALVRMLGVTPAVLVGHSAGAAIAMRMAIEERVVPDTLVSINGAVMKLEGSSVVFPAIARFLAFTPVTPWIFSIQASNRGMVDRLLSGTGSRIDPQDALLYARLFSKPGHVAGALRMMSRWDLGLLELERLRVPVTLVVGSEDRMIPPADAGRAAARLPEASVVTLPGLGHLAHEEDPATLARLINKAADVAVPEQRDVA